MKKLLSIFILLFSIDTFACSCVNSSLEELYSQSDVIFVGKVVTLNPLDQRRSNQPLAIFGRPTVSIFQPSSVFKNPYNRIGSSEKGFEEVFVIQDGSNCGVLLEEGEEFLIFGKAATWQVYTTSSCSGSNSLERTGDMVEKLKKLQSTYEEINKP